MPLNVLITEFYPYSCIFSYIYWWSYFFSTWCLNQRMQNQAQVSLRNRARRPPHWPQWQLQVTFGQINTGEQRFCGQWEWSLLTIRIQAATDLISLCFPTAALSVFLVRWKEVCMFHLLWSCAIFQAAAARSGPSARQLCHPVQWEPQRQYAHEADRYPHQILRGNTECSPYPLFDECISWPSHSCQHGRCIPWCLATWIECCSYRWMDPTLTGLSTESWWPKSTTTETARWLTSEAVDCMSFIMHSRQGLRPLGGCQVISLGTVYDLPWNPSKAWRFHCHHQFGDLSAVVLSAQMCGELSSDWSWPRDAASLEGICFNDREEYEDLCCVDQQVIRDCETCLQWCIDARMAGVLWVCCRQFELFLVHYQSNKPLVHFLDADLSLLLRGLCRRFLKECAGNCGYISTSVKDWCDKDTLATSRLTLASLQWRHLRNLERQRSAATCGGWHSEVTARRHW